MPKGKETSNNNGNGYNFLSISFRQYIILTITLRGPSCCYYPHSTDEETEAHVSSQMQRQQIWNLRDLCLWETQISPLFLHP